MIVVEDIVEVFAAILIFLIILHSMYSGIFFTALTAVRPPPITITFFTST